MGILGKLGWSYFMSRIIAGVLCLLALFVDPAVAVAQTAKKPVSVIVFPGGFNWPIWVAQDKGFFDRNDVAVTITPTPNSVFQLTNLIEGKFDIAVTAIDNVIAYMEGQGEAPTNAAPDLVVFMGGDNGFLRLVTVPEVKTYADLKGKELSVDALTTGYAFVLRKLLEKGGLKESDYSLVRAGGVLQRFEALLEKKHAGTLLLSPFEVPATARGFNLLENAIDALGRYQGLTGAARREWARTHEAELVGYIRGYLAALEWLYDPAHKEEAIAIFRKNLPNMSPELAAKSYDILLSPKDGFARRGELDVVGIRTVLALRSQYGEPKKSLADPAKYYDLRYYDEAVRR
jgi:ABC-type nitrate/sulfonate/bicarbonate transport system substrate-binding protein